MSSAGKITVIFESIRMAWFGVFSNKLRAGLTILGVIIGVTTVVAMLAVVQGMNTSVGDLIRELGSGSFIVSKFPMGNLSTEEYLRMRRYPDLTEEDARSLARNSPNIKAVSASIETVRELRAGKLEATNVMVKGLSSTFAEITEMQVAQGRVFTDQESIRRNNVCVIGPTIAQEMFPGLDPLNRYLQIDRHSFRVVGVMAERGKMFGQDLDSYVLIPYGSYQKSFGRGFDAFLIVQPRHPDLIPLAVDEVITSLRKHRGLRTADDNNFFIITQEAIISSYESLTGAVYAVMVGVAGISLIVGGIGIMNIMLVTVTERTREIGLRKAVGAGRTHLLLQFISEAAGLSSVGGLLGLLLGSGLASLVRNATPIPARVIGWSIPMAFLFALIVGVLAGLYPALKAARLHPVEALRQE